MGASSQATSSLLPCVLDFHDFRVFTDRQIVNFEDEVVVVDQLEDVLYCLVVFARQILIHGAIEAD